MNKIKQLANYVVTDKNAKAVDLLNSIMKDKIEKHIASTIKETFNSDDILPAVQ